MARRRALVLAILVFAMEFDLQPVSVATCYELCGVPLFVSDGGATTLAVVVFRRTP